MSGALSDAKQVNFCWRNSADGYKKRVIARY
jgi:hypothetical protein